MQFFAEKLCSLVGDVSVQFNPIPILSQKVVQGFNIFEQLNIFSDIIILRCLFGAEKR